MQKVYCTLSVSLLLMGVGPALGQVTPPAPGTPPPPAAPAPPPAVGTPAPGDAPAPPAPAPAAPLASPAPPTATTPAKSVPYGAGMKVNISADGTKYLRFLGWAQFWAQYNENNSNTLRQGNPKSDQLAFSMRRARFITLAQLNPRFLLLLDLGIENQSAVSGGAANDPTGPGKHAPLYMHEAVGEYRVNKYLNIGAGLNYQTGISRMTAASTSSMLAYDIPVVNFPTLDQTDQFGFFLGAYAKGRIGSFNYRVAVDDAFAPSTANTPATVRTNVAAFNPRNTSKIYQGYFSYEFWDKEANLLPFTTGTYLGTKRVLNVGAGFHYNANGMFSRPGALPATLPADPFALAYNTHDIKLFGADVFYDAPLDTASNTALTVYGVYYNYNFGPNYVRNAGVLNPGTGVSSGLATLAGNALPLIGTGQSVYVQAGLLLPKQLLGPQAKLQPYVAYLHNSLEGLRKADGTIKGVNVYDAGLNVYLDGHNAKLTLNYRARPDFSDQTFLPANNGQATVNSVNYRPEVTLQAQVYL